MSQSARAAYALDRRLLHWLMALMIIGLFAVGLYMRSLDYYNPWYHSLPFWHKSFGLLLLVLWLWRLLRRIFSNHVAPLSTQRRWERRLARSMHLIFYALIPTVCLLGYLISTAKGEGIAFFGLFEVPALFADINEQQDLIGQAHLYGAWALIALAALHALAALKHHFIDRDRSLMRIIKSA